jgi:hypothetical protein
MNLRTLILAAASVAAISPSISQAAPENAALNACARVFAASVASPGGSAPGFKLKYLGAQPGTTFNDYYSNHEYTFYLQAHDPKSGLTLARATCTTDIRGTHVALSKSPADGAEGTLAARL